ncbi:50S ribosomal protein L23 [Candidatus Phytoplasma melaleucae]|uniref:Large ribosomal subunit protein uL23 n=1 Tax=Candidatus Phytoplasma melaleucae TaxID=2982630 RepID=A0ABT9DDL5_9MOLU|nr:50S ribosomal protein L23 ['Melaleuca sp.' phytoplasma]MDO8168125.1 50S ribosomal protein L23 ['Melaleuca sp.' phytoplasma]MDV3205247.1 50S ribosomal protein L23 [Weeping tea tree witches'-broom phytoplasma]
MIKYYDCLKSPIITESTNKKMELHNKYTFKVDRKANKIEIKKAVEYIFNVKVLSINTSHVLPKFKKKGKYAGYTSAYKKAIVQIVPGQRIVDFGDL